MRFLNIRFPQSGFPLVGQSIIKYFGFINIVFILLIILTASHCQRRDYAPGRKLTVNLNQHVDHSKMIRLAIFPWDLTAYSGEAMMSGESVADLFASHFLQAGFDVIDRNRIREILKEQGMQMSGIIDQSKAIKAGKLLGADGLVFGEVTGSSENYILILKCISVEKGSVVWYISSDFANPGSIVAELMKKISKMKK
jgi:hypothetical protein